MKIVPQFCTWHLAYHDFPCWVMTARRTWKSFWVLVFAAVLVVVGAELLAGFDMNMAIAWLRNNLSGSGDTP